MMMKKKKKKKKKKEEEEKTTGLFCDVINLPISVVGFLVF